MWLCVNLCKSKHTQCVLNCFTPKEICIAVGVGDKTEHMCTCWDFKMVRFLRKKKTFFGCARIMASHSEPFWTKTRPLKSVLTKPFLTICIHTRFTRHCSLVWSYPGQFIGCFVQRTFPHFRSSRTYPAIFAQNAIVSQVRSYASINTSEITALREVWCVKNVRILPPKCS